MTDRTIEECVLTGRCSGCGSCGAVCPADAIALHEGPWRFLFPSIDKDTCINCGKCRKVCPFAFPQEKTGTSIA